MKKLSYVIPLILALIVTACGSAPRSNGSNFASAAQNGGAAGELPPTTQIALGTLKLDKTANEVTADQAAQLLPLWETMKVLESSDTAAKQEIDALNTQIQETMTTQQIQAITAMNLTRQDMFAVMQAQGTGSGNGQQNSNPQNGNRNFGGGFVPGAGGPPPDERALQGGQGFGGQGQNRSAEQIATAQAARQAGGGNRIPTPLINALIEFLKKKAGS
jgi:hypothetical protein